MDSNRKHPYHLKIQSFKDSKIQGFNLSNSKYRFKKEISMLKLRDNEREKKEREWEWEWSRK